MKMYSDNLKNRKRTKKHKRLKSSEVPEKLPSLRIPSLPEKQPILKMPDISESNTIRSQLSKKTFIEETGLSFERAFRIDDKADSENVQFDCFERKNIAKYRLSVNIPIGLSPEEKGLWPETAPRKKDSIRYFSKKALKELSKINSLEEIIKTKVSLPSCALEFIPVSSGSKRVITCEQDQSQTHFDGVSIDWKFKSFLTSETTEKSAEAKNKLELPLENELQAKTILYNKKLCESPNDIQLWLDFVSFQDELCNSIKNLTDCNLNERNVTEKKISILDKALQHNPKSADLNITRLNLCRSVMEIDKLLALWDNLVFVHANNPQVWQGYLLFVLSNITYFSTPRILKLYAKCLRTLSNLSEGIIQSHDAPADLILNMLGIFSELCFILNSSGYTEKAVALFQALIEFNLFSDSSTNSLSVSDKIMYFEPFWDSGAPRIGEEEAIGWNNTVLKRKVCTEKITTESDLNNLEDDILYKKLPLWKTWLEFEKLREIHHWLPWRPNPHYDQTDDDVDDADRIISFDDVSKFLFQVSKEEHKFMLLLHFLKFLGFSLHAISCNFSVHKLDHTQVQIENYEILSNLLSESIFDKQFSNPLCFQTTTWTSIPFNFINNIFSQIIEQFSLKYQTLLSFIWLKFRKYCMLYLKSNDTKENNDGLKRFAKSMLKKNQNRNCLLLWFEYIQLEWLTNKSKAKKTFETLLISSTSAITTGDMELREMWYFIRSYIDLLVGFTSHNFNRNEAFSSNEIIWLLILIGCREKFVPYSSQVIKSTVILKSLSGFKCFLEKELNSLFSINTLLCYCTDPCTYSAIDCAKCYAYLLYFTQGLDAAMNIFRNTSETVDSRIEGPQKIYILEQICVAQAELIYFHTWKSNASMKPLQAYLYESVATYPENGKLLYLLVKLRSSSCVVSPTRRFFSKLLRDHKRLQPVTWIFALASEFSISYSVSQQKYFGTELLQSMDHNTSYCGIHWKIRSLYERALQSHFCAYSPILWISYMNFEMLTEDSRKAKNVFHRAMQNCGWSKKLLMLGIEYFPDDLKQILDFMTEKHIRIHTPVEEVTLLMEHGIQSS